MFDTPKRGKPLSYWLVLSLLVLLPNTMLAEEKESAIFTVAELEALGVSTVEESIEMMQSIARKQSGLKRATLSSTKLDVSEQQAILESLNLNDIEKVEISRDGSEIKYHVSKSLKKDGLTALYTFTIIDKSLKESKLDPIVTTATKSPIKSSELGDVVRVIHGDELEALGANSIEEALNLDSGFSLNDAGGVIGISQNGFKVGNVKILVNGIDLSDAIDPNNAVNISFIPVKNIDRIEFVSGSQSTVHGSGSTAGVINIITKTNMNFVSSEIGNDVTLSNVGLSQRVYGNELSFFGQLSSNDTQSVFSNSTESDSKSDKTAVISLKNDNVLNGSLNSTFTYTVGQQERDAQFEGFNEVFADDPDSDSKTKRIGGSLYYRLKSNDSKDTSLSLSYLSLDRSYVNSQDSTNTNSQNQSFISNSYTLMLDQNVSMASSKQQFFYGLSASFDDGESTGSRNGQLEELQLAKEKEYAAYSSYLGHFKLISVSGGLRVSKVESIKVFTTYNLGLFKTFQATQTTVRLNYKTGYRTPTLYERFAPQTDFYVGNPNLEPEESESKELSLTQKHHYLNYSISFFETSISDLLTYSFADLKTINSGREKIQGTTYSVQFESIKPMEFIKLSYTNLAKRAYTKSPKNKFTVSGSLRLNKWQLGQSIIYTGKSDTFDEYTIVNTSLNYTVDEQTVLNTRVHNLFNTDYEVVEGYETPGRTLFLGFKRFF